MREIPAIAKSLSDENRLRALQELRDDPRIAEDGRTNCEVRKRDLEELSACSRG